MLKLITDFRDWLFNHANGKIFRYVIYRRVYTPYEIERAFSDESMYESSHYTSCYIEEAIELDGGDWLLGTREVFDDDSVSNHLDYVKLSEIRLSRFDDDEPYEGDETEVEE